MSNPVFLHVMSDGSLWVTNRVDDIPSGTITGSFRFSSDAKFQKIGTLSGTVSSNLSCTGNNGRHGKDGLDSSIT